MRRWRPVLLDVAVAATVAIAGILPSGHEPSWAYPLSFAAGAALVFRRRFPRLVVLASFPALLGQLGTIPAGVALYSLGRARPSSRSLAPWVVATTVVTVAPVAYEALRTGNGPQTWGGWVVTVLVVLLLSGAPAAVGQLVSTRQQLAASVDALRAAEAERDRAVAARARADERTRMARDVHDVVGHYASLIAVQASAMESTAPDEETRRTAATLRGLSSRALEEMRSAVTDWVERPEGEPAAGDWTRWVLQPAEVARDAGIEVTIDSGDDLPAEVAEPALRALHRVVQEGVTNAVKHSPGAAVRVTLGSDGRDVRVEIRNALAGEPTPAAGGSGVVGLGDRIRPLGGTVTACPDGEEWVLAATVPVVRPIDGQQA